jgi:hypothetical protein
LSFGRFIPKIIPDMFMELASISMLLCVLLLGYFLLFRAGFKSHFVFGFGWIIFTVYYFATPVYFYFQDRSTVWGSVEAFRFVGENITPFYARGFLYFSLALLFILTGYFIMGRNQPGYPTVMFHHRKGLLIFLFFTFYFLIILNFLISGINPLDILLGSTDETLWSVTGGSNYLKNFADSLITCLVLAWLIKVDRRMFFLMALLSLIIFLLMGFRYRIIMTLVGLLTLGLLNKKVGPALIVRSAATGTFILYLLLFITYNRFQFVSGDFDAMVFSPSEFEIVHTLAEQTRGALDDINIIQYYETRRESRHDYGLTFLYFIIRAIPRSLAGEWKDSMYPPPAFPIVDEAYNLPADWGPTGEAPLFLSYFLISGGLPALILLCFLSGFIIRGFLRNRSVRNDRDLAFMIILQMALFQWFTRGYFPQFVDHLFFLLVPYWIYFKMIRREEV